MRRAASSADRRWSSAGLSSAVRRKERGAALIVMMTLLVLLAISLLLDRLNQATALARVERDAVTARALQEAKAALIAYSVFNDDRPGSLPCPDAYVNPSTTTAGSDGFVDLFSGTTCPSLIGRFPWRTLGIAPPRDASGEVIWYAQSQAHLDHPNYEPINSETPGLLSMADGTGDLVAVLIAPGRPLPNQGQRDVFPVQSSQFLEENNTNGDTVFVAGEVRDGALPPDAPPIVNDRVLTISRAELMAAVETRVLAEAARLLREYRTSHGAYPWLIPFDPQRTTAFLPVVGTVAGHLPVVDPEPPPPVNPLSEPIYMDSVRPPTEVNPPAFTLTWNLANGNVIGLFGSVQLDDLTSGSVSFPFVVGDTTNNCRGAPAVSAPALVRCTGTVDLPVGGPRFRRYQVDIFYLIDDFEFDQGPTVDRLRTRRLFMEGALPDPPPTSSITVTEWEDNPGNLVGGGTYVLGFNATGTVAASGEYAGMIDGAAANDPETLNVPDWFLDNQWERLVYAAYAPASAPGGGGCTPGADCLQLTTQPLNPTVQRSDVEALVFSTGEAIGGGLAQDRVTPDTPRELVDDYFERDNVARMQQVIDATLPFTGPMERGNAVPLLRNDRGRAVSCVAAPPDCM